MRRSPAGACPIAHGGELDDRELPHRHLPEEDLVEAEPSRSRGQGGSGRRSGFCRRSEATRRVTPVLRLLLPGVGAGEDRQELDGRVEPRLEDVEVPLLGSGGRSIPGAIGRNGFATLTVSPRREGLGGEAREREPGLHPEDPVVVVERADEDAPPRSRTSRGRSSPRRTGSARATAIRSFRWSKGSGRPASSKTPVTWTGRSSIRSRPPPDVSEELRLEDARAGLRSRPCRGGRGGASRAGRAGPRTSPSRRSPRSVPPEAVSERSTWVRRAPRRGRGEEVARDRLLREEDRPGTVVPETKAELEAAARREALAPPISKAS